LFYVSGGLRNQVWVVDVEAGTGLSASKPRLLLDLSGYTLAGPAVGWDISRDGRRFLLVKKGETESLAITEMTLVQNWFEELKRLVPVGKK
jgi:hypothetical protein